MSTPVYNRVERFLGKIKKGRPNECWEWQGSVNRDGYGKVLWEAVPVKRWRRSHRVVWELKHGEITDPNLCVLHTCDNPLCCNIRHLWLGTRKDNNLDKVHKGRQPNNQGVTNPRAKLTERNVKQIRKLLAKGETQDRIAARFGVIQAQISRIKNGVTWRHIVDK